MRFVMGRVVSIVSITVMLIASNFALVFRSSELATFGGFY
jgi:hypothetical protein